MECNEQSDGSMDCNESTGRSKHLRWDYAMDNALLDTLVEAVEQGHKQGNTWHNHVWKRVNDAVYQKTHQVVCKKHVESRLRTMKTEYKIFAELKERNGFTWDPVKQIISAPYGMWEELIKETGKFKNYRDRGPKWDFKKLSIIIGKGHASDDLPEIHKDLANDDLPEINKNLYLEDAGENINPDGVGENMIVPTAGLDMDCNEVQSDGTMDCNKTPGRTKHLRWHSSMDIALLDTFLEAAKQGHRQGNTWHKNVWTRVCDAVFERTNRVVKKKHIECRLRTMRAEYKSFAELKERSGFTWDPVKQIITAPYEKWEELAKETGKYKSFRDRGPKWDFETLSIIVGNDHVSDDLPAVDKDLNSDDVGENANMDKVGKDANLYNVGEDDANVDNVGDDANLVNVGETLSVSTAGIGKRLLPSTHKRRNDKKRRFIRTVKGMIDGINVKIEQMAKPVDPMSFTKTLHSEVMKTKGLSMEYLDSAFAILRRDPIEAEIFLVRNMEFRKKMLEGLRKKIGDL